MPNWTVTFSRSAGKQYAKLKLSGRKKPNIVDIINLLILDLREQGPYLSTWPNFDSLGKDEFHCHLKKGRPTFVACWRVISKSENKVEIYYVGTHEGAPY